jgi:ketosteroid isomerase-like protein
MTMSVADNLELVRRAYAAFSAGDIDTLSGMMAPDIVHSVPGSGALSGAHKGIPNVLAMYGQLAERSGGTVRVELEDVLSDGGDRVIAIHTANAERNGKTLSAREALLFTIADGRVAEIQDFFSDIESSDSFWS